MPFTPDAGGSNDQFLVSPQTLKSASPTYSNVALDVHDLQKDLLNAIQTASGDMFLILEFDKLASILEHLQARISAAMECASTGLSRMSVSLEIAAEEYESSDLEVSTVFTIITDDKKRLKPLLFSSLPPSWKQIEAGIELDPFTKTKVQPEPVPTPDKSTVTQPSVQIEIPPEIIP